MRANVKNEKQNEALKDKGNVQGASGPHCERTGIIEERRESV